MPRDRTLGFVETADDGHPEKFKCGTHDFYTDNPVEMDNHMRDKNFKHYVVITNGTCFHCGDVLNCNQSEGVEYRHFIEGKATHKKCRQEMYNDVIANG